MVANDTWRDRLIETIIEVVIHQPDEDMSDIIEVVCMAKGPMAESYYKGLSEYGVRRLVKEVNLKVRERQRFIEEDKKGVSF